MFRPLLLGAIAAACLTASAAAAAPCSSAGDPAAKRLNNPPGDMAAQLMIGLSLGVVLTNEKVEQAKAQAGCERAVFTVGADQFALSGENTDATPRKAVSGRAGGPIMFLTPMGDLSEIVAAEAAKKPAPKTARTMFVLVLVDKDSASALRLYDQVPTDEVLIREIGAALRDPRPFARLDKGGKGPQIFIQTPSEAPPPRRAEAKPSMPPGMTPPPGAGGTGLERLNAADGKIFVAVADGAVQHQSTGFVCPNAVNSRPRVRLMIFDASDDGRDVACGYGSEADSSWYTLYLTKIPSMSASKVFNAYEDEAKTARPPKGRADPPLKPGSKPPAPRYASFWKNRVGGIDGLWMVRIGDWNIKLRASLHEEDQAEAKAFAEAIFAAVYAQVKEPEI
ncbi:hypothetical protein BH11PSE2_BH11PSE2_07250 [soil metagenome]